MDTPHWQPACAFPDDLVWPVRLDPTGVTGPTRHQARRGRWRRCARGWYVPTGTDPSRIEQRILEQAVRLGSTGAITAWAALRWHGATYFDGLAQGGRVALPVPLLRMGGGRFADETAAGWGRSQLAPSECDLVHGVWCATIQRGLFDEMRFASLRQAVKAMEMAAAAGLISTALMREYVAHRPAWEGVPLTRAALLLAGDDSRSPRKPR